MRKSIRNLSLSGLFLALGLLLPFLTAQVPSIGNMLLPMHIPVLLCGFVCGWPYGLVVGFILPLLRSLLFTMPPIYPQALTMAFELAAYGLVSGLLYQMLPKKPVGVYLSLLISMIAGRVVWGVAAMVFYPLAGIAFGWKMFFTLAVTNAIPGIVLQLILIPILVFALQRAKLMDHAL